jgi:hypothetical protein
MKFAVVSGVTPCNLVALLTFRMPARKKLFLPIRWFLHPRSLYFQMKFLSISEGMLSALKENTHVIQTVLTFLHLHRLIFIIVCKKAEGKTIPVQALRVPGG